jgi:multicomponent Na+:H+ antiporter subunit G
MNFLNSIIIFLMVVGALFMVIAGWGVVRMPDTYTRLSATSKSATLGIICILLAAMLHFADNFGAVNRALATILFVLITVPISAHMLGRAAKIRGEELWSGSVIDESENYHRRLAENLEERGFLESSTTEDPWRPRSPDS